VRAALDNEARLGGRIDRGISESSERRRRSPTGRRFHYCRRITSFARSCAWVCDGRGATRGDAGGRGGAADLWLRVARGLTSAGASPVPEASPGSRAALAQLFHWLGSDAKYAAPPPLALSPPSLLSTSSTFPWRSYDIPVPLTSGTYTFYGGASSNYVHFSFAFSNRTPYDNAHKMAFTYRIDPIISVSGSLNWPALAVLIVLQQSHSSYSQTQWKIIFYCQNHMYNT
jgi:hypothetical protein